MEVIPNPEKIDYGYFEFYDSIDTTIQGYKTYDQVMGWGIDFPYADKKNYVLTRKQGLTDTEHVSFVSENHIEFIKGLKNKSGKDIWIIGGSQINTMMFNAKLIDEITIHIMPIVLPDGIELFGGTPIEKQLNLLDTKAYANGVVELRYGMK